MDESNKDKNINKEDNKSNDKNKAAEQKTEPHG